MREKSIDMTDFETSSRTRIALLLDTSMVGQALHVCGWVRTFRNDRFLAINDGSTLQNLQLVVDKDSTSEEVMKQLHTGASVQAYGTLVESQGGGQATELQVQSLRVLGAADPDTFPIQMKRHSLDFLREKGPFAFPDKHVRGCIQGAPRPSIQCTRSSMNAVFTNCTPPSSRAAMPKGLVRCSE